MDIKAWRQSMSWTQKRAAEELGLTVKGYQEYERGSRFDDGRKVEIPVAIRLATEALSAKSERA